MRLSLIAAMDENRLIGGNNKLLWHLPAELQYFKKITWGKPIIMGRKTHESIGRALPGRRNIIITHHADFNAQGCETADSLDSALALVKDNEEAMIIGGAQIYRQTLPLAQRLYITIVHHSFNGDVFFPDWKASEWIEVSREERVQDAENPYALTFLVLERTEKR